MLDLAAESKDLGALGFLRAHGCKPLSAAQNDLRHVGKGLHVVFDGRGLIQTLDCRIRRTRTRLAAVALDRGHERGLLAAHERACAQADVQIEVEAGVEDVFTEQPVFARLLNGNLQTGNGDRILRTDIDIALGRADGIAGDRHGFNDGVRIALKNGAIHERTGVALVGVTDDILLRRLVRRGQRPLSAGREAAAASAAQTGVGDHLDDVLGRHFGQHLAQSGIAVHGDVFVDVFGVNNTAVAQNDAVLCLIERGVVEGNVALNGFRGAGVVIDKALDDSAFQEMLGHDLRDIVCRHAAVERAVGMDDDNRAERAQTEAAGLHDLDLFGEPVFLDGVGERLLDCFTA